VEPSSLIFVALAVAWAVYLGPKLFAHHDEGLRSRTVSTFSKSMRVLARREPGTKGKTDLVKAGRPAPKQVAANSRASEDARQTQQYVEVPARLTPKQQHARRLAAKRATRRRRNVLAVILFALVVVAALTFTGVIGRIWAAAPVVLLVAWLVTCRVMVRRERSIATVRVPAVPAGEAQPVYEIDDETGEVVAVFDDPGSAPPAATGEAAETAAERWDPVEPPLPTYVSKPAAPRRTVRTIDLDSTGVWSSGRSASDSALAREAEEAERTAKAAENALDQERRASGS